MIRMTMERLRQMIMDVANAGTPPRTILLTEPDADALGLPKWTTNLFGLKVVIAGNILESRVVPHFYESVILKRSNEDATRNYDA